MSRDHDNLLRGQGLFRQAISGFATRWKFYLWTTAWRVHHLVAYGVPTNTVVAMAAQMRLSARHRAVSS